MKSECKSKTLPTVLLIQRSENSHWTIMKRQLLCDYFIYNFIKLFLKSKSKVYKNDRISVK